MRISASGLKQQFIPVNGIINARDLGGYIMQDGRRLRDGMLIRSAHMADATDADLKYLSELPVAKVIDFRNSLGDSNRHLQFTAIAEHTIMHLLK